MIQPELWVKDCGGAIALDSFNNVYISGGSGITKYDTNGTELWAKSGGGIIAVDSLENAYTTTTESGDYVTTKYSGSGDILWSKRYDSGGDDQVAALKVASSGNIYVTGSTVWFQQGRTVKYDVNGNEIWVKTYNGSFFDLAVDDSENVYATGRSSYSSVTVKYDATGNELWSKTYRCSTQGASITNSIALDLLGNVYVAGYGLSSGWFNQYLTIKFNQDSEGPIITITDPQNIWPPDGKMTNVPLMGTIADKGAGVAAASYFVDDEYGVIAPSGNISLTSEGGFYLNIPLEAYRKGSDSDGRDYTIHITAMDKRGNTSTVSTHVKVLHDQREK